MVGPFCGIRPPHVMAQGGDGSLPGARLAIGPPVEDGFYYDFELPDGARFEAEDLERIEAACAG